MGKLSFPTMEELATKLRIISSKVETFILPEIQQLITLIHAKMEALTLPKAEEIIAILQASVPWLIAVLITLLVSGIVKAVRYRLSYKPTVNLPVFLLGTVLTYP